MARNEAGKSVLSRALPHHFTLFPFVENLWKDSRAFLLPRDDESWFLRIARVLYKAEDQNPSFAQVFVQLAAGTEFRC